MGKHYVWDSSSVRDLIIGTINLITSVVGVLTINAKIPGLIKKFMDIKSNAEALASIYSICKSESINDIFSGINVEEDAVTLLDQLYDNTDRDWSSKLVNTYSNLLDFFESVDIDTTLYRQKFEYTVEDNNFEIYINTYDGTRYALEKYKEYISNN